MAEEMERSNSQLEANVLQFVHNQSVDGRIRAMVLDLVNQALRAHEAVLSNSMKDAITKEVLKTVLTEMLAEME